jgi:hypothetical protein
MDFQFDTTADGRTIKMLNVIDEFTREALAIETDRSIDADGVVDVLDRLVLTHGARPRAALAGHRLDWPFQRLDWPFQRVGPIPARADHRRQHPRPTPAPRHRRHHRRRLLPHEKTRTGGYFYLAIDN